MADERKWIPVEVLWDEDLRRNTRETGRFWSEIEAEEIDWSAIIEDNDLDIGQLSKRRRKKSRGERERGQ